MIRFDTVTKSYPGTTRPALNSVSLEILKGEFVFLVGASGSGKSSFLRLILREENPTKGAIHVLGQHLNSLPSRKVPYFRRNLGVVFQDFRLLPNKTVFDNVAFTLQVIGKSRGFIQEAVPDALKMVGLAGKSNRYPHELSGGEQQRVAIARAVVNKPAILLADEPTGNLDPATSAGIMTLLERISLGGTTVLMATHDAGIVDKMQRRVIELISGQIVRDERQGGYQTQAVPIVQGFGSFGTSEVAPVRLGLILGEAGNGLRRNVSMVISVILVTFISLTFVGAAILLQMQIGQMKGYWYDKAQVAVYMCTDVDTTGNCSQAEATKAQIDEVKKQLDSPTLAPYIEKYEYEDHEQAYANFQSQFSDSPIAAFVTPDTLNESFRVNLVNPNDADVLIESLSGSAGVQNVEDQRGYLDQIFSVLNAASATAIGIAVLMLIAAVLLIATTIRLSARSRRRELGIMRLVGASNRFIQTPFILEGVFASFIGSLLAGAAIVGIVQFFVQGILVQTLKTTTTLVGLGDALTVVPILIVVGALLAAASASVAISRYLKV